MNTIVIFQFQRSGDSSTVDSSSRFDIFGPEMADLQELLVSMASSDDSLQSCDVKTTSNDSMGNLDSFAFQL